MPRRLAAVVLTGLAALAGADAAAAAGPARAPEPLVDAAPLGLRFHDRVIATPRARIAAATPTRAYRTQDGTSVRVGFTRGYREDARVAQSYADFLAGLPHGPELARLRVLLATPAEITRGCGEGALGCYLPTGHRMVVPGEAVRGGTGVTTSYVVTHEYGHHVAALRSHAPFPALDFGPKRWSSYERVCSGVLAGRFAPGDQAGGYDRDPGESWAEVYARLTYPDAPWRFTALLEPDLGALLSARADVLDPWRGPVRRTFTGTFGADDRARVAFLVPLTLDGSLAVDLSGPEGAQLDLRLAAQGRTQGQTRTPGSRDRLRFEGACRRRGVEPVTVSVLRRRGAGPFTLTVTYAG